MLEGHIGACMYVCAHFVRFITSLFLNELCNALAEMITIMTQCVTHKTQICIAKVKITLRGQRSKIGSFFVSSP